MNLLMQELDSRLSSRGCGKLLFLKPGGICRCYPEALVCFGAGCTGADFWELDPRRTFEFSLIGVEC